MAAILKEWRLIRNRNQSIDAHLLKEHFCKMSSRSHLKRRSPGLFCIDGRPNKNKKKNKVNSKMGSVPDPKSYILWPLRKVREWRETYIFGWTRNTNYSTAFF